MQSKGEHPLQFPALNYVVNEIIYIIRVVSQVRSTALLRHVSIAQLLTRMNMLSVWYWGVCDAK